MRRIFYGWWIVLATSLIHLWAAGTFFYTFTAFFTPIVDEFGWSYAATSFAASLRSIEGGIASPLVGFAADRYGARRLLVLGSILTGLGYYLFSRINSLLSFYLVFIFLSIGSSFLQPIPGWTAVANWFMRKRGIALGILSAAIGAGGMLIYIVSWLIGLYGWRSTLVLIGMGTWMIGIPLSLIVRHRPEPYGLFPDGEKPVSSPSSQSGKSDAQLDEDIEGFTVGQAIRTRAFWVLTLTLAISSAVVHAVMVHVMPFFISGHFNRELASLIASLVVLASTAGRFFFGWATNRTKKHYLLAFGLFLQAAGILFLAWSQALWQAILFVILFGPGYGGVITLRLTIQAEYFGRKAFGAIQGVIIAILVAGTIVSPLLTGMVFDRYNSYRPAWLFMAAALLAGIPLSLKVKKPRIEGNSARPVHQS